MKKLIASLGVVSILAVFAIQAALAAENPYHPPLPANLYCLNGETVNLPAPISFGGGTVTRSFGQGIAEAILSSDDFAGGVFWMGYVEGTSIVAYAPTSEKGLLASTPAPSLNTIARGACIVSWVNPDRSFWLCYHDGSYPWVGSRADAERLYDNGKGWKVPIAVRDDSANGPHIGNGITLSCNFAAYQVATGLAFSTGQGEAFNAISYAKVSKGNALDYTQLMTK